MSHLPGTFLPLLGLAILADVASPMSSCGCDTDSPEPPARSQLQLSASDCSCAPNPISVSIDGVYRATVNCGTTVPYPVPVEPGRTYAITATSSNETWATRNVQVPDQKPVSVDLGCPQ